MSFRFSVVACALIFTHWGCGRSQNLPPNLPELFPLSITILQEKSPLDGAFVRLVPEQDGMPWSCGGTTDSSGVALIKTIGKFDGAPEGNYKVLVSKLEMSPVVETNMSNLDEKVPQASSASYDLVDPKYSLATSTPINLRVSKGSPKAEFDVGNPVRTKRKGPPR